MCVDPDAIRRIDPQGIRVLGAKIVGKLNLSGVKVPFAITLRRCSIPELMNLSSAEMPTLDLGGSYTGPIHAQGIGVANYLGLGPDFHAKGIVNLMNANLGLLGAFDGHFQWAPEPDDAFRSLKIALNLIYAKIRGTVWLFGGFESRGGVSLFQATIGAVAGSEERTSIDSDFDAPASAKVTRLRLVTTPKLSAGPKRQHLPCILCGAEIDGSHRSYCQSCRSK